eukprot:TRINITY_DN3268_c0_g1_i4.p1 TRINITY_DN3268_c0_g1~~TRINITY_DN3268_c0_g1_i4.p1  ORF type:complete len:134 (+),score=24.39 TRINITY_DN3268_c0_g1_i4:1002-1403(+)
MRLNTGTPQERQGQEQTAATTSTVDSIFHKSVECVRGYLNALMTDHEITLQECDKSLGELNNLKIWELSPAQIVEKYAESWSLPRILACKNDEGFRALLLRLQCPTAQRELQAARRSRQLEDHIDLEAITIKK